MDGRKEEKKGRRKRSNSRFGEIFPFKMDEYVHAFICNINIANILL